MKAALPRRALLVGGATAAVAGAGAYWFLSTERQRGMRRAAAFVLPRERWNAEHLYRFLAALPDEARQDLLRSQRLADSSSSPEQDARRLREHLLWLSTNVLT